MRSIASTISAAFAGCVRRRTLGGSRRHAIFMADVRTMRTGGQADLALDFERTIAYLTGLADWRDAIPFPQAPGNAWY
jgi:aspartyl/asparaginyl-tRNA synthetase